MRATQRVVRLEEALQVALARAEKAEAERARLETALHALSVEARRLSDRAANATMTPEKLHALLAGSEVA